MLWEIKANMNCVYFLPTAPRVPRGSATLRNAQWIDELVRQAADAHPSDARRPLALASLKSFVGLAREHVPQLHHLSVESPALHERVVRVLFGEGHVAWSIGAVTETQAHHAYTALRSRVFASLDEAYDDQQWWDYARCITCNPLPTRSYMAALVSGANAPQSDVLQRALSVRGVCRVDAAGWLPLVSGYTWGGALGSLRS